MTNYQTMEITGDAVLPHLEKNGENTLHDITELSNAQCLSIYFTIKLDGDWIKEVFQRRKART